MIVIRNYDPVYLEQREYGIIQDIYHSGLKRTGKKWIGRAKSNISGIYNRKAAKELVRNRVDYNKVLGGAEHVSVENKQPLYDAAKNVKARINRVNLPGGSTSNNFTISNKDYAPVGKDAIDLASMEKKDRDYDIKDAVKELRRHNRYAKEAKQYIKDLKKEDGFTSDNRYYNDFKQNLNFWKNKAKESEEELKELQKNRVTGRDIKKINRAYKSSVKGKTDSQIFVAPNTGDDILGHEIGHQMNKVSKNPITRLISKVSTNARGHYPKDLSLKEIAKDRLLRKTIEKEERNASKNSIKLLKKSGAPKEELRKAKDNLNTALDSYKSDSNYNTDAMISRKYQIKPGMRNDEYVQKYHTLSGKRKKMIDLGGFGADLNKHYGIGV